MKTRMFLQKVFDPFVKGERVGAFFWIVLVETMLVETTLVEIMLVETSHENKNVPSKSIWPLC